MAIITINSCDIIDIKFLKALYENGILLLCCMS